MMLDSHRRAPARILYLLLLAITSTHAQTRAECEQRFQARSGQPGKDVMWVATIDQLVTAMLRAAQVTSADRVVDLGSGDGKIPIAAARQFGAHARGIEYNADLVRLAECHARAERIADKVKFEQADIFAADFSEATVLTLYLSPTINLKLRPTILNMRPGTRVVSNAFDMADWEPDRLVESEVGNTRAFLWIVPANVNGAWTFSDSARRATFKVALDQKFQQLRSTPASSALWGVQRGRLNGSSIELTVVDPRGAAVQLQGQVTNGRIEAQSAQGVRYVGVRAS